MKLFICYTPLQILIAKRVIEYKKIKEYSFVYFYDSESDKNTYYFHILEEKSKLSIKSLRTKNAFLDLMQIIKIFKKLKQHNFFDKVDVYTGNIKAVHTRLLMFLLKYTNLYTFDDGCGNVISSGYYANNQEHKLYKLFFLFFKPSLVYETLRNKMITHYSIYNENNIYPNVEHIKFLSNPDKKNTNKKPIMTLLLTSVLSEDSLLSYSEEVVLYKDIISWFKVTHYVPHPREQTVKILDKMNIIDSSLISEEIILELANEYELTVIGVFSAALLNLSGLGVAKRLISIDFANSFVTDEMVQLFTKRNIECYRNINGTFVKLND